MTGEEHRPPGDRRREDEERGRPRAGASREDSRGRGRSHPVCDHPLRSDIRRLLAAQGGPILATRLQARLGVSRSTLLHHLSVLQRRGLLRTATVARRIVVTREAQAAALASALGDEPLHEPLLQALRAAGGSLPRALAHRALAGLPLRTRNYRLRRAKELGLVEETVRDGRVLLVLPGVPEPAARSGVVPTPGRWLGAVAERPPATSPPQPA